MNHYKSWSGLRGQLREYLCEPLRDRIDYFLTRYHEVHDTYGRVAIRFDGRELVSFSWVEMREQENDLYDRWKENGSWNPKEPALLDKWEANATFSDMNFLQAATDFLQMPISEALESKNPLIRVLAILDRRVGSRTLRHIRESGRYRSEPAWVRQFYDLRMGNTEEALSKEA